MEIKEFLLPTDTLIKGRGVDKKRLLQELAARAAAALNLDADLISFELLKREDLGSTGTGGGVAIPHARIPGLKKPFGTLVRLKHAIDFDAIDGKPVDIVFLLLLPAQSGDPLNALACVARKLRDPASVQRLRSATDDEELYRAIEWGPGSNVAVRK
jgi:PTS system nitrogen regulatory IIA component